jgi:hypothetical protein
MENGHQGHANGFHTRFQKGRKRTGGRVKGKPNRVTVELRDMAAKLLQDPEYQDGLIERAKAKKLHPAIEVLMWHYAIGKPTERLQVTGVSVDPSKLSDAELLAHLQRAVSELTAATQPAEVQTPEPEALALLPERIE